MLEGRECVLGSLTGAGLHALEAPLDADDRGGVGRQVEELLVRGCRLP